MRSQYQSKIPETKPLLKGMLWTALFACVAIAIAALSVVDATGLLVTGLGMAVTANQLITKAEIGRVGLPVLASTTLYQGTLAFVVAASGYVTDSTASGANDFVGVVIEQADNSSGANGDINVELYTRGVFVLTGSGFTQAIVGDKIYASDNYTVTGTSTSNSYIGKCVGFISSTQIKVDISSANASV